MVTLQGKRNTVQEGPDPLLFQLRACSTVYFYQGDHASVSIETASKYGFAKNGCVSITEYSWMKRMELIVVHSLLIGRIPLEKEGGMGVKQQYTEYNRTNCIING